MRNLEWVTPDVMLRVNHIRFRCNLTDLTRKDFIGMLKKLPDYEYNTNRLYFS